ncbi:MMPL family transporter [Bathymodiolus septemdierum thioautotrophic gill symbiont]|nr:MMPL family transporter [Bathymodiolus septemdierum thioautotrophic gill symbiont]
MTIVISTWYLNNHLLVVSNIEQFLPSNIQDKNSQVLIEQSQKGASANLILVQILESNSKELSRLSQSLKAKLQTNNIFDFIVNSQDYDNLRYKELLKYRYLLHDNSFEVDELRNNFAELLSTFTANAPNKLIDYLLIDPQKAFLDYLFLNQVKTVAKEKHGVWFVADKSLLMIQIQENSTTGQQDIAIKAIKDAFINSKPGSAKLLLSGPSVVATQVRENIQDTIKKASFVLLLVMFLIFIFVYRSVYLLLLANIVLGSSILIAMTMTQIIFGQIHGIVLAFGITALGVCLDYPLHIFSNISAKKSASDAVNYISNPLKIGLLTSIFAYVSLMGTGFDGLNQLAVFAIVGLFIAFVVSVYLIPVWMRNQKVNKREVSIGKPSSLRLKFLISFLVVLLPAIFLWQQNNLFNASISQLNPASIESRQIDSNLRQALGVEEIDQLFLVSDKDLEGVLAKTKEIRQQLKNLINQQIIAGSIGVDTLLPSKKMQQYRQSHLPSKETLQSKVALSVLELPFKKGVFKQFIEDVSNSKTLPLLNYQAFKESIMGNKMRSLLFTQEGIWYSLIRIIDIKEMDKFSQQVDSDPILKDAYYSVSEEASNIMDNYLSETWNRLLLMMALLFFSVLWFSRKDKSRIWIVLPVFSGVLISLSFQVLLGNSIGIFHLLSLLLVVGLGFDYSLFFNYENIKAGQPSNSTHAITISAITTIMSFSVLTFSEVSVLSSIGQVVVVGVLSCFIVAKFVSTPTLSAVNKYE